MTRALPNFVKHAVFFGFMAAALEGMLFFPHAAGGRNECQSTLNYDRET